MTTYQMKKEILNAAAALQRRGVKATINFGVCIAAAEFAGQSVYYSQGEDAALIIDECSIAAAKFNVEEEAYLLFYLDSAGCFN